MATVDPDEIDGLWDEFHTVVNMTSRELSEWLRTDAASPTTEDFRDRAGSETGQRVLHILSQRKGDVDAADAQVMREVVDAVRAQHPDGAEPVAGDAEWRHRLMSMGHDPLKPTA